MINMPIGAKGDVFNFPKHDVPPAEKLGKDWNIQYARAMYYLYINNRCGINYSDVSLFNLLRAYGNGVQPITKYMDILDPQEAITNGEGLPSSLGPGTTTQYARKGYMNIDWNILKIAPKFKTVVIGNFEDVEHDVFADGIDEKSSQLRENEKWALWAEMEYGKQLQELGQSAGVNVQPPAYIPETMQELEMFSQMGGFRLKSEIAIESALSYTLWLSRWKEIKPKLIADLFEIGIAGVRDDVDPNTQKVTARYCDPNMCIIPWSRTKDYRNMPFAGEFVYYTIAELRALTKPEGGAMFTDEELYGIAKNYVNYLNNPNTLAPYQYNSSMMYEWNNFNVMVLDCEFKSDDYKYTETRVNAKGETIIQEGKFGVEKETEKRKTTKTKTLMVYKCKWIVGTDYAWDYGHQFDIPRPTPSEANLSFHFSRVDGPSMITMMIEPLDQIQLTFLKIQNALATAAPNGLAIDIGSVSNVTMGNNKMSPLDLFKIRNQTGTLLYAATTHRSYSPVTTNYKPIQELQGGIGQQLNEYLSYMEMQLSLIQEITGINRIASAANPQGEDLVGVSQLALQATATALKPMYNKYLNIKERMCQNAALRIQLLVKVNKYYEGYYVALGMPTTQILKIGGEINNAMYNIRIVVRPSAEEKRKIEEAAMISMQAGRNGQPGISMADYLTINRFIQQGMLKYAETYLAYKESVAKKEAQEIAAQNSQMQGQQMQQLEQMKQQNTQQVLQLEMEKESAKITQQSQANMAENDQKHKHRMEELELELRVKSGMNNENNQVKVATNSENNQTKIVTTAMNEQAKAEAAEEKEEKSLDKKE